jgi:hypothetical protein
LAFHFLGTWTQQVENAAQSVSVAKRAVMDSSLTCISKAFACVLLCSMSASLRHNAVFREIGNKIGAIATTMINQHYGEPKANYLVISHFGRASFSSFNPASVTCV